MKRHAQEERDEPTTAAAGLDRYPRAALRCEGCRGPAVVGYEDMVLCGRCFSRETILRERHMLAESITRLPAAKAATLLAEVIRMLQEEQPRGARAVAEALQAADGID